MPHPTTTRAGEASPLRNSWRPHITSKLPPGAHRRFYAMDKQCLGPDEEGCTRQIMYVRALNVIYDNPRPIGSLDDQDVNKGFGGEYVWLVPYFTDDPALSARSFSLHKCKHRDTSARDISKGDGKEWFRYLNAHYGSGGKPIKRVYLSETCIGDGQTADLNSERGGRKLYLCWSY